MQGLKPVRKIVYAKVYRSSKDYLSRETNAIFPTLRSCKKQIFPRWFKKTKKLSSFGKWTTRLRFYIRLCQNYLLWAFAAGILWKNQPRDNFARVPTAKCIANCNHDGSLEDDYYVPFFKLNFSYPHYVTCFACQSFQIFTAWVTS